MAAGLQLGWLKPAEGHNVAVILIAFVFPLQLLTSVFGYLARDVVAGTAMGILSGTWLSIGLVLLTNRTRLDQRRFGPVPAGGWRSHARASQLPRTGPGSFPSPCSPLRACASRSPGFTS